MALDEKLAKSTMVVNLILILGMSAKNENSFWKEFRGHILVCSVVYPRCERGFFFQICPPLFEDVLNTAYSFVISVQKTLSTVKVTCYSVPLRHRFYIFSIYASYHFYFHLKKEFHSWKIKQTFFFFPPKKGINETVNFV